MNSIIHNCEVEQKLQTLLIKAVTEWHVLVFFALMLILCIFPSSQNSCQIGSGSSVIIHLQVLPPIHNCLAICTLTEPFCHKVALI